MNKILRKLLVTVLVLTLALSGTAAAFGEESADNAGIKVQYNGEYIDFPDAAPKIINGRTMVPLRHILETMGAEVNYDPVTNEVDVKKDQIEFSFVIGGTDITITKNGETSVNKMDVVPYLDGEYDRTYVSARFMADSLGSCVGWDSFERTAVIIDPAALFSNADEDFSVITRLFTTDLDMSKAYKTTGTFDMSMIQYDPMLPTSGMKILIDGDLDGVQQETDADLDMNLKMTFDGSSMPPDYQDQMAALMEMFKDISMRVKLDGESGAMYMNSNMFSAMDPSFDSNTWFKMDIFAMYDDMGFNIRPWMKLAYEDMSLTDVFGSGFNTVADYIDSSTYSQIKTLYAFFKNLIGDEAFKQQTVNGITTYTLSLNETSVLAAMTKTALTEGIGDSSLDLSEIGNAIKSIDLNADIVIKTKDDKLHSYDLSGSGSVEGSALSVEMSGDQMKAEISMDITQKDVMEIKVNADTQLSETNQLPSVEPPPEAKIVDYDNFL